MLLVTESESGFTSTDVPVEHLCSRAGESFWPFQFDASFSWVEGNTSYGIITDNAAGGHEKFLTPYRFGNTNGPVRIERNTLYGLYDAWRDNTAEFEKFLKRYFPSENAHPINKDDVLPKHQRLPIMDFEVAKRICYRNFIG